MPPRIDPARREIAVGTRRLPFRLDLRNDRVSVTLGGAETAVRPLLWREKVTLARFAGLGPEFLRDEVIRLCTVSELPSPLASEDAEVLWELAAWMSESPSSAPVPLDSRSLATVTLRLCRAMGLKPADFDSRSAPEVEALWEALGQPAEEVVAEESSSSSTTRIVIVPDEVERTAAVPAADREASRLPGGGTAHPGGGRDARSSAGGTPAVREVRQEDGETAEQVQMQTQTQVQTQVQMQMQTQTQTQVQTPAVAAQSIGAVAMASAMPVFAAVNAEPRAAVIPSVARDLGGRGAVHVPAAPPTQVPRSTLGMTADVRSDRGWAVMPMPAAPPVQVPRSTLEMTSVQPVDRPFIALAPESIVRATDNESRAASDTPHDFFEELADRLEQAAAEMGLGEE